MEKKRRLPARAAAREQSSKKRQTSPPPRSETPAPPPAEPVPDPKAAPADEPPPSLPTAVAPGKPLPTVETLQPDDLSIKDYQSIQESGVLGESLARSRSKWLGIAEGGIFKKYWSKPTKKKGVVQEDPNNPPKDSMMKLGQVTIIVEPHCFEATMFAVKDLKPTSSSHSTTVRPVLQYGPPNNVMPPPTPKSATPAPTPIQPQTPGQAPLEAVAAAQTAAPAATQDLAKAAPQAQVAQPVLADATRPGASPAIPKPPAASPRGMESFLSPTSAVPQPPLGPSSSQTRPSPASVSAGPSSRGGLTAPTMTPGRPTASPIPAPGPKTRTPSDLDAKPPPKPAGADPIILTLAERAGEDPELRDLMKKVAQGEATKDELERFQRIIDHITAESRRGPTADKLLVDKRSVKYYAREVRAILNIVLKSNPSQTSATLKPPEGSNPLVIALVKLALDDPKIKNLISRIADDVPSTLDPVDLKAKLDELYDQILREQGRAKPQLDTSAPTLKTNGISNGQIPTSSTPQSATATQAPAAHQALRSKGPPPPLKADIAGIVFEFAGGNGDRYLFPKFSILETRSVPPPQQEVIASFLLVRKGSRAEYPRADPELDYYEPLTIRLFTSVGRHLEQLARVVAPQEEVRRYMDDVMSSMTRAEYVVPAMRLPRPEKDAEANPEEREKGHGLPNGGPTGKQASEAEPASQPVVLQAPQPPPPIVQWISRPPKPEIREVTRPKVYKPMDVDDQYQSFISTVKRKDNEVK